MPVWFYGSGMWQIMCHYVYSLVYLFFSLSICLLVPVFEESPDLLLVCMHACSYNVPVIFRLIRSDVLSVNDELCAY
jgi:ABC-type dipeptide/oligopeptide/nickel transport system permease subunit